MTAHTKPLQTTRVSRLADLDAYYDTWRALAGGAPLRSPEWLLGWWQCYGAAADELCVLLFHEASGSLVGLAPLFIERKGKGKTIRLLGSGEASTNHTTWLAAAGWEKLISCAVAQFLLDFEPGWQRVQFESADAADSAINATVDYLLENGCLVRRTPRHNCWQIALPSTWDDYLRMLSKTQRKRCLKLQRQLLEPGRVQVHHVTSEADFDRGFGLLQQLHAARWGDRAKPLGCFSDRRFREFHEKVARQLLRQKQLLLTWLEYEGKAVAAEYQFIGKKTVYSYQAGMDPAVTEFPPGNLSIMSSIHYAIAQGCQSFDFSRGDQPYKANWRAVPFACHDICIWHDDIPGRWEHALSGLRDLLEQTRMMAVTWIKARVPAHAIDFWRRMIYTISGERRGPRKMKSE